LDYSPTVNVAQPESGKAAAFASPTDLLGRFYFFPRLSCNTSLASAGPVRRRVLIPEKKKKKSRGTDRTASPSRGPPPCFLRCTTWERHAVVVFSCSPGGDALID